jgi:hypothetical protein
MESNMDGPSSAPPQIMLLSKHTHRRIKESIMYVDSVAIFVDLVRQINSSEKIMVHTS